MNVLDATRHRERRLHDLNLITNMGWRVSRYYVDTELVGMGNNRRWECIDGAMAFFERSGYQPYFEFFHHILPFGLSYADPDLYKKTEDFALAFAERYPWANRFCIVNELLCSTLFSGLFGIWPPYASSMAEFTAMLVNAQRTNLHVAEALLKIRPNAQFLYPDTCEFHIAADDESHERVKFRNELRFLGDDLAKGLVRPGHSLFDSMSENVSESDLEYFINHAIDEKVWVRGLNCYTHSVMVMDKAGNHYACKTPPAFTEVAKQYIQRYPNARWSLAETNLEGTSSQKAAWWRLVVRWAEELGLEECCYWSALNMSCWDTLCREYNYHCVPTGLIHLRAHQRYGPNWIRTQTRFGQFFTNLCQGDRSEWPINVEELRQNLRLRPFLSYLATP